MRSNWIRPVGELQMLGLSACGRVRAQRRELVERHGQRALLEPRAVEEEVLARGEIVSS
jgi:hypothetical protein